MENVTMMMFALSFQGGVFNQQCTDDSHLDLFQKHKKRWDKLLKTSEHMCKVETNFKSNPESLF